MQKNSKKMEIVTLEQFDTEFSADSIEWCPEKPHQFVCGTYQLQENDDESTKCQRVGRIYLFQYLAENNLENLKQIETNAVLDMKWKNDTLAVADSKGFISLYKELELLNKIEIDVDLLALSLDWSKDGRKIVVSDSHGKLSVIQVENRDLKKSSHTKAHEFEAWIAIFDKHRSDIVYTGGDDCVLNCFDLRTTNLPVWKNKTHSAGVTSLLSLFDNENLLITGSYDEKIRTIDIRKPKSSLTELNLGGGIWRIKQHPKFSNLLLTANMYHNFAVVNFDATNANFEISAEYFEHKSICYGADWSPDSKIFATCSFYDHKMCVARIL